MVDKLIEECTKTNDEKVKTLNINESKFSSCILYIVIFSIFLTINVGIAAYFVYYKCINHDKETDSRYDYVYHAKNY